MKEDQVDDTKLSRSVENHYLSTFLDYEYIAIFDIIIAITVR